jgi:hypothetical protein
MIFNLIVSCAWVLENHENPYDFTISKPNIDDIAGKYQLTEASRKRLNIPKNIADTIYLNLKFNKTFEFKNIPENKVYKNSENFETKNEKGTWDLKFDENSWVLPIITIGKYDGIPSGDLNSYHLNKQQPPYQIVKIINIETWESIVFEKK